MMEDLLDIFPSLILSGLMVGNEIIGNRPYQEKLNTKKYEKNSGEARPNPSSDSDAQDTNRIIQEDNSKTRTGQDETPYSQ